MSNKHTLRLHVSSEGLRSVKDAKAVALMAVAIKDHFPEVDVQVLSSDGCLKNQMDHCLTLAEVNALKTGVDQIQIVCFDDAIQPVMAMRFMETSYVRGSVKEVSTDQKAGEKSSINDVMHEIDRWCRPTSEAAEAIRAHILNLLNQSPRAGE